MSNVVIHEETTSYIVFAENDESVVFSESPESFVVFTEGAQGVAGPTGASAITWNETPSGLVNGSNDTYTLAASPASSATLLLSLNGLLLRHGASNDFTLSANTITFTAGAIPATGDTLLATYSTV